MLAVEQEVSYKYIKVGQGSLQRFNPTPFVFGEESHTHSYSLFNFKLGLS